jgi:hypothetical protein
MTCQRGGSQPQNEHRQALALNIEKEIERTLFELRQGIFLEQFQNVVDDRVLGVGEEVRRRKGGLRNYAGILAARTRWECHTSLFTRRTGAAHVAFAQ